MADNAWEAKAAAKRSSALACIPKEWRLCADALSRLQTPIENSPNNLFALDIIKASEILTPKELQITEKYTVLELLDALAKSTLSAVEVTTAFSKRAAIAQQLVCLPFSVCKLEHSAENLKSGCLTEILFDKALERACSLDALRSRGGIAGPLHGLPISIKDSFQIAGTQATIGLVSYLPRVSEANSPLVDLLLQLGAVLYVKTNIPQTLMVGQSLYPRNPHPSG